MGTFNFSKFVTSLDVFGEPVSLNYGGDSSFKTGIGALFSIAIKTLIFVYAIVQFL